jgi:hypothetical protein
MKYINKLNIDFNQWDKIENDINQFDEDYVLSQLNDNKKINYLYLKKYLLEKGIFDIFFNNLLNDNITGRFKWYINLIKDKVELTNENKIIYFLNINSKLKLVDSSFDWRISKEGYTYWLSIEQKYENDIYKIYIKY